jgi:hypothetical protein
MELADVVREMITPALEILGLPMTPHAVVLLLAIGQQESRFVHRRQLIGRPPRPVGPAKSFWQGEQGGGMVAGVRTHPVTRTKAVTLYVARGLGATPTNREIWDRIEIDDVLAAGLARLLLLSDPKPLPAVDDVSGGWVYYLRTWRPGAWERGTEDDRADLRAKWERNHAAAQAVVS